MTTTTTKRVYPTELTEDVLEALGAPVPASEIKTLQHGGQSIRYTTDKFVFDRLDEVVGGGNWHDDYSTTDLARPVVHHKGRKDESLILGQVVCRLKVLGVMKSAVADMELTDDMYGTPGTNAQARAVKRAAMKFGIARELWEKDHAGTAPSASGHSTKAPSGQSNGRATDEDLGPKGQGYATAPQIKYLNDAFKVPPIVARELTSGRQGTASAMIDSLNKVKGNEDYGTAYIIRALEKHQPALVALMDGAAVEDDDEDED